MPYSQSWRTIWGKGVGGCHLWLDWAAEKSIQRHFQSFQRNQALGEISKCWSFEPGFQTSCFNSIHNKVFLSSYLKHIEKNTPKCEGQSLFLPHFQHHRDPCRAPCPAPDSWISLTFLIDWIGGKANECSYQYILLTLQTKQILWQGVRWIKPALPQESTEKLWKVWRPRPKQSLSEDFLCCASNTSSTILFIDLLTISAFFNISGFFK